LARNDVFPARSGEFFKRYSDAMKKIGRYRAVFVPWTVQAEYQEAGDFTPWASPKRKARFPNWSTRSFTGSRTRKCCGAGRKFTNWVTSANSGRNTLSTSPKRSPQPTPTRSLSRRIVLRARKRKMEDPDAPLIIGVDPGRRWRGPVRGRVAPGRQDFEDRASPQA
jgi:hypothetical protein